MLIVFSTFPGTSTNRPIILSFPKQAKQKIAPSTIKNESNKPKESKVSRSRLMKTQNTSGSGLLSL